MVKKRILKLKNYQKILTFLTVLADSATIILSFLAAYFLWGVLGPFLAFDMYEELEISRYALLFGLAFITVLIGFEVNDLYQSQRSMLNIREFHLILRTCVMACGFTMVILYMANELYFSRGMFVLTWILILFFLMVERYGFFKFYTYLNSLGIGETVVIIYGTGVPARQLIARFSQSPKLGYYVAGFIEDDPVEKTILGLPVLGSFENLKEIIQKAGAEKLFIALGQVSSERVIKILNVCRETGCKFQVIPTLYETALERVRMTDVEGIPLIGFQEPKPSLRTVAAKRLFDFFIGLFLLIVLFFPAALVAGIIRIIYRRQVFSQMICIGKKGRHFNCYSFAIAEPEKDFSEEPEKTSKEKRSLLEMKGFYR
jgi:FlaA1/EpsC-like NDP-sugar epimerase